MGFLLSPLSIYAFKRQRLFKGRWVHLSTLRLGSSLLVNHVPLWSGKLEEGSQPKLPSSLHENTQKNRPLPPGEYPGHQAILIHGIYNSSKQAFRHWCPAGCFQKKKINMLEQWILPSHPPLNNLQQLGMGLINMFIRYGDLSERRKGIAGPS